MRKEIITFVIGLLVGAIITTGVFLVIRSNDRPNIPNFDKSNIPARRSEDGEPRDFDKSKFDKKDFNKNSENSNVEESNN